MALEQGNVTLTHFLPLIYFARNRFPTVILADVAIQQWWINILEIWSRTRYDVMMVWWYDDTRILSNDFEQWFISCLHPTKGQRMTFSCFPWYKLPWKTGRSEGFSSSWTNLSQCWLRGSAWHQSGSSTCPYFWRA